MRELLGNSRSEKASSTKVPENPQPQGTASSGAESQSGSNDMELTPSGERIPNAVGETRNVNGDRERGVGAEKMGQDLEDAMIERQF